MNDNLPPSGKHKFNPYLLLAMILVFICLPLFLLWYQYLGPPPDRALEKITTGMSKNEVTAIVGKPDWVETLPDGSELWAFRSEWGLSGLLFPNYLSFSPKGLIDITVWS